jgi:hypothetical protein
MLSCLKHEIFVFSVFCLKFEMWVIQNFICILLVFTHGCENWYSIFNKRLRFREFYERVRDESMRMYARWSIKGAWRKWYRKIWITYTVIRSYMGLKLKTVWLLSFEIRMRELRNVRNCSVTSEGRRHFRHLDGNVGCIQSKFIG